MASPDINIWFRVDITLKHLQDQTSKVITVTSRPLRGENPHETFPILDSINGLGLAAGQSGMPTSSTGSITLIDTFESFGAERRFFDLLERYTPIEQTVQVYAAQTALDDNAAYSDFVSVWKGKTKSVSKSDNLTLEVEAQIFETRYVNKKITNDITGVTVPEKSLGKALPLVFGSAIELPAYPVSNYDDNNYLSSYLYAINLGSQFQASTINKYYVKDTDGRYTQVYSKSLSGSGYSNGVTSGSNYPIPLGLVEKGSNFGLNSATDNFIVSGGRWWFKGQNASLTPPGNLFFNVYLGSGPTFGSGSADPYDTNSIAKAQIAKSDYYTEVSGASDFWVEFYFDKPFVFSYDQALKLLVGLSMDQYATSTTDFVDGGVDAVITGAGYYRLSDSNQWRYQGGSLYFPRVELFGLNLASGLVETVDSNGIVGTGFLVGQRNISGLSPPDISDIDFIVEVDGLTDDVSGNITGTPSSIIKYPNHILKLMGYTWNGSAWADSGNYDFSQFSSLYSSTFAAGQTYSRYISGATEGEQTLEDFLSSVMDQSASKLVQLTNGKLTIWPWGVSQAVSRVFTDENSKVISWKRLDSGSIINQVKISYAKSLINAAANDLGAGGNSFNFGALLDWTVTSYPLINMLVEDSQAIYGKKPPSETELNLVNDSTSAETYGYSLLRQFDHPHTLAQISVDFWKNRDLELMQIIELVNPKMPGHLGTSSKARLPTYDGNDVQVSQGDYFKRATRYRCQIISREISWGRSSLPSLVFGLRVITPYHLNDPT